MLTALYSHMTSLNQKLTHIFHNFRLNWMLSFIPVAVTPKMYNIPILFICESLKLDLKIGLKNGIEPIEWRNRIPYYSRAKRPIYSCCNKK